MMTADVGIRKRLIKERVQEKGKMLSKDSEAGKRFHYIYNVWIRMFVREAYEMKCLGCM